MSKNDDHYDAISEHPETNPLIDDMVDEGGSGLSKEIKIGVLVSVVVFALVGWLGYRVMSSGGEEDQIAIEDADQEGGEDSKEESETATTNNQTASQTLPYDASSSTVANEPSTYSNWNTGDTSTAVASNPFDYTAEAGGYSYGQEQGVAGSYGDTTQTAGGYNDYSYAAAATQEPVTTNPVAADPYAAYGAEQTGAGGSASFSVTPEPDATAATTPYAPTDNNAGYYGGMDSAPTAPTAGFTGGSGTGDLSAPASANGMVFDAATGQMVPAPASAAASTNEQYSDPSAPAYPTGMEVAETTVQQPTGIPLGGTGSGYQSPTGTYADNGSDQLYGAGGYSQPSTLQQPSTYAADNTYQQPGAYGAADSNAYAAPATASNPVVTSPMPATASPMYGSDAAVAPAPLAGTSSTGENNLNGYAGGGYNASATAPMTSNWGGTAGANAATPTTTLADGSQAYTVGPNEGFWHIAEKFYQESSYYKALAAYNQDVAPNADELRFGTQIKIPALATLEAQFPHLCPSQATRELRAQRAAAMQTASPATTPTVIYTVQHGDSIFRIAEAELNDRSRWTEIWHLNKDILAGNADDIQPNMQLRLPADAASSAPATAGHPGTPNYQPSWR